MEPTTYTRAPHRPVDARVADLVKALQNLGVAATFEHTGGGIMCCCVEPVANYEWMFGLSDINWGASFSRLDADQYGPEGHLFSVYSGIEGHDSAEEAAAWALSLLRLPHFIASGTSITLPYMEDTGRFGVDPWEYYGLPYPYGALVEADPSIRRCYNCQRRYHPTTCTNPIHCILCLQAAAYRAPPSSPAAQTPR